MHVISIIIMSIFTFTVSDKTSPYLQFYPCVLSSVSAIVAGSSQEEESSLFCRRLEVLEDSESRYSTTYKPNCIQYVPLKYTNTYETYSVTTVSAQ